MSWFHRMFGGDPPPPTDKRDWNDDWRVGDTAECIADFGDWHESVKPWRRPAKGAQFIVTGFSEEICSGDNSLRYLLHFQEFTCGYSTSAFRKVRPIASENSEIVERILTAKAGKDIKRPAKAPKTEPAA